MPKRNPITLDPAKYDSSSSLVNESMEKKMDWNRYKEANLKAPPVRNIISSPLFHETDFYRFTL